MNKDYLRHPQRPSSTITSEYALRKSYENDRPDQTSSRRAYQKHPKEMEEDDKDSRIMEIRRKYDDVPLRQANTNLSSRKENRSCERDEDIMRKIKNIKNELKSIPNWERYAKSIFFEENSQNEWISPREFSSKKQETGGKRLSNYPEKSQVEFFGNESKNFEIRHTSSINQSEEKSKKQKIDRKAYINEF